MAYICAAFTVCVIIFSTGRKFQPVSNFSELHALSLATHSYALLLVHIIASYAHWCFLLCVSRYLVISVQLLSHWERECMPVSKFTATE